MLNDVFNLLQHGGETYRTGKETLYSLGHAARKEVSSFYAKINNAFLLNGILDDFAVYRIKTAWQRGYSSKITTYFSFIIMHKGFMNIGSSIDVYIRIRNGVLELSNSITLEYDHCDKVFDPQIQNSLGEYKGRRFLLTEGSSAKKHWRNLEKIYKVNDFENEDELINEVASSTKKLTSIFKEIIEKKITNKDTTNVYKYVESAAPAIENPKIEPSEKPGFVDGAQKAREKKAIGNFFEARVLEAETQKLQSLNLHPEKVDGDGYGYDIKSYDKDGNPIYIEVKGTNNSRSAAFFLTANEVEAARKHKDKWFLYRIYKKKEEYIIEVFSAEVVLSNFLTFPSEYKIVLA